MLTHGLVPLLSSPPLSSSSSLHTNYQQQTIALSGTLSTQSFSPKLSKITDVNSIGEHLQQQTTYNDNYDEKEQLKKDLIQLKNELQKSKETIARLQKSEEQMRER